MLFIVIFILCQLQTITGGYDSSQASDYIHRYLGAFGGNCQDKCEEDRPDDQGGNSQWRDGMFNCYDKSRQGWECFCHQCQRHDCSIDETSYVVSACDIDTIQDRTQDLQGNLIDLVYNHYANCAGIIPVVGPLITAGMTTAKGAYDIYQDDEMDVLNGVIADINRQADQLKDCMDERIDLLEAQVNLNEMQDAWYLFDIAAGYDGDDFDDLMDNIKDAWTEHLLVANSEFDDIDGQTITYFKTLLLPLQAFVQTFAQVSVDYLKNLYAFERALYPDAFGRTIEGFETLKTWANAALDAIYEDMDTRSHAISCEDGSGLAAGLAEWGSAFTVANIDPIDQYIEVLNQMNALFNRQYIKAPVQLSWPDAENYCQEEYGTHLATITNDVEKNTAATALQLESVAWGSGYPYGHIGLNSRAGEYAWTDGTSCDYATNGDCGLDPRWRVVDGHHYFTDSSRQCGMMRRDNHLYYDGDCIEPAAFICNMAYRKYIRAPVLLSWSDAEQYCQDEYDSHLATITNDVEMNKAVETLFLSNEVAGHIGMNRLNGEYAWADGTSCDYATNGDCGLDPRWRLVADGRHYFYGEYGVGKQCASISSRGEETHLFYDAFCSNDVRAFICNDGFEIIE